MLFISPSGKHLIATGRTLMNVSREHLDGYLLDQAVDAGVRLVRDKVVDIKHSGDGWLVRTTQGEYQARLLVGADGVNSLVRSATVGRISNENLGVCMGYMVRGVERDYSMMRFLRNCDGYVWVFPRDDHSSIGVGTRVGGGRKLRGYLEAFIEEHCPHVEKLSRWGALIPTIRELRFYDIPCAGGNWLLLGDAAGHVDPILGEGIRYALWSAELAAKAIAEGDPAKYDAMWREAYLLDLKKACRLSPYFYKPWFLNLSLGIASRSRALEWQLTGIVSSETSYVGLKRRTAARLPLIAAQVISSYFRREREPRERSSL
jgi:flavin-dependent dehydrogenase